jgi:hypothetical protein
MGELDRIARFSRMSFEALSNSVTYFKRNRDPERFWRFPIGTRYRARARAKAKAKQSPVRDNPTF